MFGTHDALDAIADRFQSVATLGEDQVYAAVQEYFDAQNALVQMVADDLVERTSDYLRRDGGLGNTMKMQRIGEYTRADAQKPSVTSGTLGFPIFRFGNSVQWTRDYFRRASGEAFANTIRQIAQADLDNYYHEIRYALFRTDSWTFVNEAFPHTDGTDIDIPVKPLANAESGAIYPSGPHGVTFDDTHQHYVASASLTATVAKSFIANVTEHSEQGEVLVYINKADEDAWRALTGFVAYTDPRVIISPLSDQLAGGATLDIRNTYNRRIGIFKEAEIWVKPWVPASYAVCFIRGVRKVLAMRIDKFTNGEIGLVAQDEAHPLRAQSYEREFGIGVQNRVGAAVLYTGGVSYVVPSV